MSVVDDGELRAWLELRDEDSVELAVEAGAPETSLGQGLARAESAPGRVRAEPTADEIRASFAAGTTSSVPGPDDLGASFGRAAQLDSEPNVVLLAELTADIASTLGHCLRLRDDELVLDARDGRAMARLVDPSAEWVVTVEAGWVRWFRVTRGPAGWGARVEAAAEHDWPTIDVPDPEALAAPWSMPGWLRDIATMLARSPSPFDRAASVGLVARLWTPARLEDVPGVVDALVSGADGPASRAVSWARSLAPEAVDAIEQIAVERAATAAASLDAVGAVVAHDPAAGVSIVEELLRERDRLASVELVLGATGRTERIERALDALDEVASANVSAMIWARPRADGWLRAVWTAEPRAWWASTPTES